MPRAAPLLTQQDTPWALAVRGAADALLPQLFSSPYRFFLRKELNSVRAPRCLGLFLPEGGIFCFCRSDFQYFPVGL